MALLELSTRVFIILEFGNVVFGELHVTSGDFFLFVETSL